MENQPQPQSENVQQNQPEIVYSDPPEFSPYQEPNPMMIPDSSGSALPPNEPPNFPPNDSSVQPPNLPPNDFPNDNTTAHEKVVDGENSASETGVENERNDVELAHNLALLEDQMKPLESMIDHIDSTEFSEDKKANLKEKLTTSLEKLKQESADIEKKYTESYRRALDSMLEAVVNAVTDKNELKSYGGSIELVGYNSVDSSDNNLTFAQKTTLAIELAKTTGAIIDDSIFIQKFDVERTPFTNNERELKSRRADTYKYIKDDKFGNNINIIFTFDKSSKKNDMSIGYALKE